MSELKPCPFCEHRVLRVHAHSRTARTSGGKHHFVRCPTCHTEGPRSLSSIGHAIALWNARSQDERFAARSQ